jgi:hypothetical protein
MAHRKGLFQYAILFHPKPTKDAQGNDTTLPTEIVVPITPVLAGSEQEVAMLAARQIPEKYLEQLAEIEVIVTAFFRP